MKRLKIRTVLQTLASNNARLLLAPCPLLAHVMRALRAEGSGSSKCKCNIRKSQFWQTLIHFFLPAVQALVFQEAARV